MSTTRDHNLRRIWEQMRCVDSLTLVVLKGHLLLEEQLERIIKGFVHHPSYVEDANLRFVQKVAVARSMSLDESTNRMWDLILSINALRNELSHSLASAKRQQKFERLMDLYLEIYDDAAEERDVPDHELAAKAIALTSGFLGSFEKEVGRFRNWIETLDLVVNPHRHEKPSR